MVGSVVTLGGGCCTVVLVDGASEGVSSVIVSSARSRVFTIELKLLNAPGIEGIFS